MTPCIVFSLISGDNSEGVADLAFSVEESGKEMFS